ncbi:MAG TPA: hypothetical protein VKP00_02050, partial [Gemmatimonadaceae bacterium]|nr:hypothetical protein [Gemmatimonadaceae bacterium]
VQEQIIGILVARQVGTDNRRRVSKHVIQPIEEHRMHVREMTRVLVGGPPLRRRPPLEDGWRHFPH